MIAYIVAMNNELLKTFKTDKECFIHVSGEQKYYVYENKDKTSILCFSGIGKVNAASCAAYLIKTFKVDNIINIGAVGSNDINLNVFDYLLIKKFYYIDVDVTPFGYKLGQVPKEKEFYTSNNQINNQLSKLLDSQKIFYKNVNIGTSDLFINRNNINKIKNQTFDLISCFDMESCAIAQVCDKNNVGFSSIKIVSDNINHDMLSEKQFNENLNQIAINLTNLLFLMIDNI